MAKAKQYGGSIKDYNRRLAGSGFALEAGRNCIKVISEGGDYLFNRRTFDAAIEEINERIRRENCPLDDPRQRATILAALRCLQGTYSRRELDDIASNNGAIEPLTAAEIDVLVEKFS